MQIEPPIWCFYCCRIDFDFHPFIGIFTEFNRSDPFITEEGDRFMLSALGLHTPVRGHASWLLCAVSTGWGYIECGTQMSGLIRHNRGSSSLHLSSPMYINGALHFLSILLPFPLSLLISSVQMSERIVFDRLSSFLTPIAHRHAARASEAFLSCPFSCLHENIHLWDLYGVHSTPSHRLIHSNGSQLIFEHDWDFNFGLARGCIDSKCSFNIFRIHKVHTCYSTLLLHQLNI